MQDQCAGGGSQEVRSIVNTNKKCDQPSLYQEYSIDLHLGLYKPSDGCRRYL